MTDTTNETVSRKSRRWPRVLTIIVALLLTGHVSNIVGLSNCEREVLRWYVDQYADGEPLRYPSEVPLNAFMESTLLCSGVDYKVLPIEGYTGDSYPWCLIEPGQVVCPFVVAVDAQHMEGNLGGGGGKVYVLNIFGWTYVLLHPTDWVS